ncbi:hypothetical protein BCR34DRAFT_252705 [Clohesyomyces aquaticus]|uniref:Secreted protein n=1 Tax=Clohesyomyces aquaticus TaxID=1231657 RepID=A0A1Y1ZVP4_9PLEO|nr:hypothetical protein BCR34DRAFT_252705 [Clohesyomyces aquaticus]
MLADTVNVKPQNFFTMSLLYFLFICSIVAILPSTASDPIPKPTLRSFGYGGNGCPQGSSPALRLYDVNTTAGSYQLTNYLDYFLAAADLATSTERSMCSITVEIATDAGYRLRVNSGGSEVRGSIEIADNTTSAHFRGAYYWLRPSGVEQSISQLWFTGPVRGDFLKRTPVEGGGVLSDCGGGSLSEGLQVRLNYTGKRNSYVPPDPDVDGYRWVVVTGIEVLKC